MSMSKEKYTKKSGIPPPNLFKKTISVHLTAYHVSGLSTVFKVNSVSLLDRNVGNKFMTSVL
jgi:hypothetical protein